MSAKGISLFGKKKKQKLADVRAMLLHSFEFYYIHKSKVFLEKELMKSGSSFHSFLSFIF